MMFAVSCPIQGLCILGEPHMTAFAIGSKGINILALADEMESKGWRMERTQNPNGLHCTVMPSHTNVRDKFVEDLTAAAEYVKVSVEHHVQEDLSMFLCARDFSLLKTREHRT
uniref:Uncharacterized protein n=1 Tax=Branchiostoma floridae TaxID=7739 RepID=C3YZ31_BRAFL|eukprot:XP_002598527.1 hypothetical protein BRAFLDRAFT_66906 [Branchiostoma floridae]